MRLCRYRDPQHEAIGFYHERAIVPVTVASARFASATGQTLSLPKSTDLLDFLPHGAAAHAMRQLNAWLEANGGDQLTGALPTDSVELLVPIPRPNKILLLAGNYAKHIEEGGGIAAERAETFPYVFLKPPSTTLTHPGQPITIPSVSPRAIDWELELAVIIGRRCRGIQEREALQYVAGYTVLNDISDRSFKPNPQRKPRERDKFFDWLHGKWHDSFCPCGPCVTSAESIPDPQQLRLHLTVNGETKQDASTGQMIFPVAAVLEFIASFVTLEPGDIVSTGTPDGVGHAKGTYLQRGDRLVASIERIGALETPVQ